MDSERVLQTYKELKQFCYQAAFDELAPSIHSPEWTKGQEQWAHETAEKISFRFGQRLDIEES